MSATVLRPTKRQVLRALIDLRAAAGDALPFLSNTSSADQQRIRLAQALGAADYWVRAAGATAKREAKLDAASAPGAAQ